MSLEVLVHMYYKNWGFLGIVKSHKVEKLAEVDLKRSTMPTKNE